MNKATIQKLSAHANRLTSEILKELAQTHGTQPGFIYEEFKDEFKERIKKLRPALRLNVPEATSNNCDQAINHILALVDKTIKRRKRDTTTEEVLPEGHSSDGQSPQEALEPQDLSPNPG